MFRYSAALLISLVLLVFAALPASANSGAIGFDSKIQILATVDVPAIASTDVAAGVYTVDELVEMAIIGARRQTLEDASFSLIASYKVATTIDRYDKVMIYRM
jgi:hypothetical protein